MPNKEQEEIKQLAPWPIEQRVKFTKCYLFVKALANMQHLADCKPCTDVRCQLVRQAQELLDE